MFIKEKNALLFRKGNETLRIEPWGTDALRVRATPAADFTGNAWGLTEDVAPCRAEIAEKDGFASVRNGKIEARVSAGGVLSFFSGGRRILHEYHRNYDPAATKETCCTKIVNREWKGLRGGDWRLTVRFEPSDGERIFGMGQYQTRCLDMKGCVLELAQRNGQVSIPFAVSSMGYGFLWNCPAVGRAVFGNNMTEWTAEAAREMDFWIVAGDSPREIVAKFTAVSGRAPFLPKDYLGFWQCKLRYRTQDEVLSVARRYRELGIHLSVIVIDFFHWIRQGDWGFDPEYWPDPKAMCDELHAMGTKVMVSVWPSVDKKSVHFQEMQDRGLLVRTERGTNQTYDFSGDCITFDATNPEAREYIWRVCSENYAKYGIDMFWLDNAEPDYNVYDWENYRYWLGPALSCSNIYPKLYSKAFYDGMKAAGRKEIVSLTRSGWTGSQKLGAVLWNGDVQSTWECLEDAVSQGVGMGLSGIPWWNTDIGGFMYGNPEDPEFVELLERWFEFAVFTPIMRLHGDREPHDTPPLCKDAQQDYGGGYLYTGRPNEIWSYGGDAQKIFEKQIRLRESLIPYIETLSREAAETGAPLMRAMFFEFPDDGRCWALRDQYMFGSEYLVAPVLRPGVTARDVYLPAGKWLCVTDGKSYSGGGTVSAPAPADGIPVFRRER